MTENKRYTCDIHRIFDNKEQLACADTMDDAEIIVDRLSQQDEEIQQLKQDLNKKMKFVAIQESESTIRVDFDEFVQLCKDSNDLKEKEERIKELEDSINNLIDGESFWEKKAKEQIQTQNKEINACYDTLTTITELCDAVLKHNFKGILSKKDACKLTVELDNKDVKYLKEVFTAIRDNDLETMNSLTNECKFKVMYE